MTTCSYHPDEEAAAKCVACKKAICGKCEVVIKGKSYCKPCVELMFHEKEPLNASATPAPVSAGDATPPVRAAQKPAAVTATTVEAAENTSGQGKGAVIPREVRGWNWGAFLLNWIWGMGNGVWIALLTFILGPIMSIILGIKGNEWAWRNKKWDSVEKFKKTQRAWSGVGIGLTCVSVLLVLIVVIVAASGQGTTKMLDWKAQGTIQEPLIATTNGQDVVLGNLQTQQVEVKLPGTAFQGSTQVTVRNPQTKAPAVPSTKCTPLGAPIEIKTGDQPARLHDLATITFKIDRATIESNPDPGSYWIAHYTGGEWEYLEPDEVNLAQGTVSIRTDNFQVFGLVKIEAEEALQQYTKSKAVAEWGQEQVDEKVKEALGNYLKDMCGKIGINDELKSELLAGVFTDDEYGNLIKSMQDQDKGAFTENLAKLLGTNMQRILASEELDKIGRIENPLGDTLENADDVATFATALGYAYEKDYTEAAKILGESALKKSIYGKAFLALKEGGEYIAEDLTNRLFEQSYQVYSKGASEPIWGFIPSFGMNNIPAHEFDLVWNQSHKVREVLIKRYTDKGFSEKQAEAKAYEYLQKRFDDREKSEVEIAKKEKELRDLLYTIGEANDTTINDFVNPVKHDGFILWPDYKDRMNTARLTELLNFVKWIKKGTNTTTVGEVQKPGVLLKSDLVALLSAKIKSLNESNWDPAYLNDDYLKILQKYKFSIVAPPVIHEGKGLTDTQYSFTAEGKNVDVGADYTWTLNYGGKDYNANRNTKTIGLPFKSPGEYTLKCKASWNSGARAQEAIPATAVATLTFNISDPSELKISVSPAMPSGKGTAGTRYTFTATGKGIPADAEYIWIHNYAGTDGDPYKGKEDSVAFGNPGTYSVKCLARWKEKSSSGGQVDREAAATPLAFAIPLTISRNPLDGEAGKSYTFTVGDGISPPVGTQYQWYKNSTAQTGKGATNDIAFPDKGTYTIEAKLVSTASGNVIAQGQATANIKAATPTPEPLRPPLPVNGSITIGSVPAGADIYVNGQRLSYQTPHKFVDNIEAGTYSVGLRKAGYKDYSATAVVAAGRLTELWAKLEAIESQPAPTPTPVPTPTPTPAKDPQALCNCAIPWAQWYYVGCASDACKSSGEKDCTYRLTVIKPAIYDPVKKECAVSYYAEKYIYSINDGAYIWSRTNSNINLTYPIDHAQFYCDQVKVGNCNP